MFCYVRIVLYIYNSIKDKKMKEAFEHYQEGYLKGGLSANEFVIKMIDDGESVFFIKKLLQVFADRQAKDLKKLNRKT